MSAINTSVQYETCSHRRQRLMIPYIQKHSRTGAHDHEPTTIAVGSYIKSTTFPGIPMGPKFGVL